MDHNKYCNLRYHIEKTYGEGEGAFINFAISDLRFAIKDMNLPVDRFVVIDSFVVEKGHRNRGFGTEYLKEFLSKHNDEIILVVSGVCPDEYPGEPTEVEVTQTLRRLNSFYTNLVFVSVNDIIGGYEYKELFIHRNNASQKLLEYLSINV